MTRSRRTSDDASHCLDTGAAPEDLLGKVDAAKATSITELSSPVTLGTASSSVPLTHKGDVVLSNGLTSSGSFLLGSMRTTLVSEQTCSSRVGLFRYR